VYLITVILAVSYLARGLHYVANSTHMGAMDTRSYANEALYVKEHGGALASPLTRIDGTYHEASQHPLYPTLLSFVAAREPQFFVRAKLLTLLFAFLGFLAVFLLARRRLGDLTATMLAALLLFNHDASRLASVIACEAVLIPLVFAGWYFALRGFEKRKAWLAAGVLFGLAYLTKGSGHVFFGLIILGAVVVTKARVLRDRFFWLGAALFLVVASPLLIRNTAVYHNPFYNANSAHVVWYDSYSQAYAPPSWENPPTMLGYLKTHSPTQISQRLMMGMAEQAVTFTKSLSVVRGRWALPAGGCLLILGLLGWASDPDRGRKIVSGVLFVGGFLATSWYCKVVFFAPRFMFPLVPIFLCYAALSLTGICRLVAERIAPKMPRKESLCVALAAAAGMAALLLYLRPGLATEVRDSYQYAKGYAALNEWAQTNIGRDDRVCHGPDHMYLHLWDAPAKTNHYPIRNPIMNPDGPWHYVPVFEDSAGLLAYLREHSITYLVITRNTLKEEHATLGRLFAWDDQDGLSHRQELPGLTLVFQDDTKPVQYLVYETRFDE